MPKFARCVMGGDQCEAGGMGELLEHSWQPFVRLSAFSCWCARDMWSVGYRAPDNRGPKVASHRKCLLLCGAVAVRAP